MTLTLLIDLDDTLLTNPLESFMPAYIKLLSDYLAPFVPASRMVPQLLYATDKMISKDLPAKTLEETFDADFYASLGLIKNDLVEPLDTFYTQNFQKLQSVTKQKPEALRIVEYAVSKKHTIVVATNPLFPQKAIQSRLAWAGFPPDNTPFQFITSYENMHFAKPNPAYYAEILGLLGWPLQPFCMIGNSLTDDILPASSLGMPGFLVDGKDSDLPENIAQGSRAGTLDKVIPWLDELEGKTHESEIKSIPGILAILKTTPVVMDTLTKNLSDTDWKVKPTPSEWSILETICHIFDVEKEINIPRFEKILSNEDPFLVGIDSDIWVNQRNYNETRTPFCLTKFLKLRLTFLKILNSLSSADWQRTVRHSIFGPTSLLELAIFIIRHEQDHIRQVYKALK
ncbi:MAG: hypothetical protein FD147_179 [Chloroflexi bacterium]|nr:MAG: hypothetical protein FD147_179 [Chloroflexota bacterium]MBA4374775.1 hypothetical protein [Anaerolinea sp.]